MSSRKDLRWSRLGVAMVAMGLAFGLAEDPGRSGRARPASAACDY
jgi:hypothetical protein